MILKLLFLILISNSNIFLNVVTTKSTQLPLPGANAQANSASYVKGTNIQSGDSLALTKGTGISTAGAQATSKDQASTSSLSNSATNIDLTATALGKVTPGQESPQQQTQVIPIQSYIPTTFQEQSKQETCQAIQINWFNTGMKAIDIGASPSGDLFSVGIDGILYQYDFIHNKWVPVEGDYEMTNLQRVDVSEDGTPYVIANTGDTFFLDCDNKWIRLPGCATDIGVSRWGDVWKTGCDSLDGGNSIYRLFCKANSCDNCGSKCKRFRSKKKIPRDDIDALNDQHSKCSEEDNEKKCYWLKIQGAGIKISIASTGFPSVIKNSGIISQYDGTNWRDLKNDVNAVDISVSNDGIIFYVGSDNKIYRVFDKSCTTLQLSGFGTGIASGPFSQPFVISEYQYVKTSSKLIKSNLYLDPKPPTKQQNKMQDQYKNLQIQQQSQI